MTQAAQEGLNLLQSLFFQGFFVFLRVGAAVSVIPAFGENSVPVRVKLGLAVSFTLIVAPGSPVPPLAELPVPDLAVLTAAETCNGLLLGIGVRMFVFALQTAGSIAAQSTSLSQLMGSHGAEPLPAIGHVLVIAGLALAVITGLHVQVAQFLQASYAILTFGRFPPAEIVSEWGVQQTSMAFSMAFRLAFPFVVVSALYNLTLGVINRAMPQLMVAFVGAPLITAGGLILLLLVSPALLTVWKNALHHFLAIPVFVP